VTVVGVGSTRGPKVEAVRRALAGLAHLPGRLGRSEVVARDVGDVAPSMPVSLGELLEGSRRRAHRVLEVLRDEGRPADLGVGLEGGLEVRQDDGARRGFLMAWAYVTDGRRGVHGCGGALELPERLVAEVVDGGVELSQAIDAFSGRLDVRSGEGAWGILTLGVLDRARSFETALLNGFAPFYNPEAYS
jgi:non-canonical (house-cleaning) NTP pyrophosphatase